MADAKIVRSGDTEIQSSVTPTLEYLLSCSKQSLQDLELASLNRAANRLKAAKLEYEEALREAEAAGVARWLIDNREELLVRARQTLEAKSAREFPELRRSQTKAVHDGSEPED